MIALIYLLPIWFLFLLIRIVFIALGLIFIPLAVIFKAYGSRLSLWGKPITVFTWPIMKPWNNLEDGCDAGLEFPNTPQWFRILVWSAYRNPTNGFRFTPILGCTYDLSKLKYITYPVVDDEYYALWNLEEGKSHPQFFYLCWQGIYGSLKFQIKLGNVLVSFWWGNSKLYPSGKYKIPNYQRYGVGPVGPSFKFKLYKGPSND